LYGRDLGRSSRSVVEQELQELGGKFRKRIEGRQKEYLYSRKRLSH